MDLKQRVALAIDSVAASVAKVWGRTRAVAHDRWLCAPDLDLCSGLETQTPRPLHTFVGRQSEIASLGQACAPGLRPAVVGIVGMGGVGKTELAKVLINKVARRYRDGVLWADCSRQDLATVVRRWDAAGGHRLSGRDLSSCVADWQELVRDREMLLVFDDLQLDQDVELLFPTSGRSSALITTRHAAHPALLNAQVQHLECFRPEEAVALAQRLLGSAALNDQRDQAERLFDLVGYLPVAIAIALETARDTGCELRALCDELDRVGAIRVLSTPSFEKGLGSIFLSAWDGLSPDLQRVLATLAVFSHGLSFGTDAVAAVLQAAATETQDSLECLVENSLLSSHGEGRWVLHPLLREFIALKPLDGDVWRSMAVHYLQLAADTEALYLRGGGGASQALSRFDQEWPHIRAGQAWAAQQAWRDDQAARLCSSYPSVAIHCLSLRRDSQERISWLEAAARAAHRLGDWRAEGTHLGNLGNAYAADGDAGQAIDCYERALAIARAMGDSEGEEAGLGNLGNVYATLGETGEAIACLERALEIAEETGNLRGQAAHLGNLGSAYYRLGGMEQAVAYHERALMLDRKTGDRQGEGADLGNLGLAHAALGEVGAAVECYDQALQIAREIGDRRAEANHLGNLGLAHATLGDLGSAIDRYQQALTIDRQIGDRRGEAADLGNLGLAYSRLGDRTRAQDAWERALAIFEAIQDPRAQHVRELLRGWDEEAAVAA